MRNYLPKPETNSFNESNEEECCIKKSSEINQKNLFRPEQPFFLITTNEHSGLNALSYFYDALFDQFQLDLYELNALPIKLDLDRLEISCSILIDPKITMHNYLLLKANWLIEVNNYLDGFFDLFITKVIEIKNASEFLQKTTYNRLRINMKQLNANKIELSGYKDSVEEFIRKNNLENAL